MSFYPKLENLNKPQQILIAFGQLSNAMHEISIPLFMLFVTKLIFR